MPESEPNVVVFLPLSRYHPDSKMLMIGWMYVQIAMGGFRMAIAPAIVRDWREGWQ